MGLMVLLYSSLQVIFLLELNLYGTMAKILPLNTSDLESSMTRQLFDANDVHQLLKRTVVMFYY